MTARADEHPRGESAVDPPSRPVAANVRRGRSQEEAGPGPAQQVRVELAAPNPVTHRAVVGHVDALVVRVNRADTEARNRLERSAFAVLVEIEPQLVDHLRRDPSGADLVAWKGRLVDNDNVEPRVAKAPGACRSRRSTADDRDVAGLQDGVSLRSAVDASPGHRVAHAPCQHDLKELQGARAERGLGTSEIEVPGADESLVEHGRYPIG